MKNRNGLYRLTAMALVLMLLMSSVSLGADGKDSDEAQEPVYSDWLSLEDLLDDRDTSSGTQNLSVLLREVALLDAEGTLLAQDSVWSVEPNTAYQIRLSVEGGQLHTDISSYPYDGTGILVEI